MPGLMSARIPCRMHIEPTTIVAELVLARPGLARVFEQLGLDYCCGGKRSLETACKRKGLDVTSAIRLLEAGMIDAPTDETDWSRASVAELVDHIVTRHHDHLREELPRVAAMSVRVAERHGSDDERLVMLAETFLTFREEMELHMAAEEHVLFPACRALEESGGFARLPFPTIAMPIAQMEHQHEGAADAFEQLRELTDGFDLDRARCNTHRALLDSLAAIERDLHEHVHQENNILFPRALELEASARVSAGA